MTSFSTYLQSKFPTKQKYSATTIIFFDETLLLTSFILFFSLDKKTPLDVDYHTFWNNFS